MLMAVKANRFRLVLALPRLEDFECNGIVFMVLFLFTVIGIKRMACP